MPKQVIDLGNCSPDHQAIRGLLVDNFDVTVTQCHSLDEALTALRSGDCHLMLVNRKLDRDYSDGLKAIQSIRTNRDLDHIPIMMVTNFDEHQQLAVEAGAVLGFGKLSLGDAATVERLRAYLS